MPNKQVSDPDNPEWTVKDFKRAKAPHEVLPPHILKAFPKTRGPQAAAKKMPVSAKAGRR